MVQLYIKALCFVNPLTYILHIQMEIAKKRHNQQSVGAQKISASRKFKNCSTVNLI